MLKLACHFFQLVYSYRLLISRRLAGVRFGGEGVKPGKSGGVGGVTANSLQWQAGFSSQHLRNHFQTSLIKKASLITLGSTFCDSEIQAMMFKKKFLLAIVVYRFLSIVDFLVGKEKLLVWWKHVNTNCTLPITASVCASFSFAFPNVVIVFDRSMSVYICRKELLTIAGLFLPLKL